MISDDEIKKVAQLARLELAPNELHEVVNKLSSILDFVATIDEVDTSSVTEFSHYPDSGNVLRADRKIDTITNEQAMKNAPQRSVNFFKTPLVVGSEE